MFVQQIGIVNSIVKELKLKIESVMLQFPTECMSSSTGQFCIYIFPH